MKLVMTLLIRDAEEILRENLEFHLKQGVDFFIVTDNRSVDTSAEIISEYVKRGIAEVISEPADDYSQWRWVTRMARLAAIRHRADWVINSDDDEFWHAGRHGLKEILAACPATTEAISVERRNHVPLANSDAKWFVDTMIYRQTKSFNATGAVLPPKVCHRGFPEIEVAQGNHQVARLGNELVAHQCPAIVISHFPLRAYSSFQQKIINGGEAYLRNRELPHSTGHTWRWLHQIWREGGLRAWYDQQCLAPLRLREELAAGTLVEDRTVLEALAGIIDR